MASMFKYEFPYQPLLLFISLFLASVILQTLFRIYTKKIRYLLFIIGSTIIAVSIVSFFVPSTMSGYTHFWFFIAIALPGFAILSGSAVGNVIGFLVKFLNE